MGATDMDADEAEFMAIFGGGGEPCSEAELAELRERLGGVEAIAAALDSLLKR